VSTAVVSVPEISCAACKTAIEGALNPLDGVPGVVVDIAARWVHGLLNPIIAGAAMGFSSVSVVADSLRLRRFAESPTAR
jgi:cation transport ATPase